LVRSGLDPSRVRGEIQSLEAARADWRPGRKNPNGNCETSHRIGYRGYELADVLHAAYANLLVTAPTPAHTAVDVVIDEAVASILLRRRGIAVVDAVAFAKSLRDEMAHH
jgi:hypothetical protein